MPLWKRQPPADLIASSQRQWFATELGRELLAQEQRLIDAELTDLFGYHLLQLGFDSEVPLFGECRVQRCFQAGPVLPVNCLPVNCLLANNLQVKSATSENTPAFVQCAFEELPFDSESLDGVIVHHVLEFASNPHAVLRELHRVTRPQGRILVVGFNPWSLFGVRMLAGRLQRDSLWHNHLLSAARVSDWLELLGFSVQQTQFGFHRLPFDRTAHWLSVGADSPWSAGLRQVPMGAVYVLSAIKQRLATTPQKPLWSRVPVNIVTLPVAKPSTRLGSRRIQRQPKR